MERIDPSQFDESEDDFDEEYTVRRPSGGWVNHQWVDEAPQEFPIWASVQPLNGREVQRLPEGDRTTEHQKIYTAFRLQTKREGKDAREADIVIIEDQQWQVNGVERWKGEYFKAIIQLRDQPKRSA